MKSSVDDVWLGFCPQVTNDEPSFEVTHLHDEEEAKGEVGGVGGGSVKLYIFAQNSKGSSEPFIIEETLRHLRQSKHAVEGE